MVGLQLYPHPNFLMSGLYASSLSFDLVMIVSEYALQPYDLMMTAALR